MVNVWDGRMTSAARMSKTNHTAAVKVGHRFVPSHIL